MPRLSVALHRGTRDHRKSARIHPDGSLYAAFPVDLAVQTTAAKWVEFHPRVGREDCRNDMVTMSTQRNADELEATWRLVVDSYNFVTGQPFNAADVVQATACPYRDPDRGKTADYQSRRA